MKEFYGACIDCLHYSTKPSCEKMGEVIETHGEDALFRWLEEPNVDNECDYFRSWTDIHGRGNIRKKFCKYCGSRLKTNEE